MEARKYLDETARNFYISHEVADKYIAEIDQLLKENISLRELQYEILRLWQPAMDDRRYEQWYDWIEPYLREPKPQAVEPCITCADIVMNPETNTATVYQAVEPCRQCGGEKVIITDYDSRPMHMSPDPPIYEPCPECNPEGRE